MVDYTRHSEYIQMLEIISANALITLAVLLGLLYLIYTRVLRPYR